MKHPLEPQRTSPLPSALLCILPFALLSACAAPPAASETPKKQHLPPPTLQELLPLKDKTVSNFQTESDLGDKGVLVLEIFRPRPEMAELKIAGTVRRLQVDAHRISHMTGGVLLEEPLEKGHSFQGSFGITTITEVDHQLELPAGHFEQCLVTVEESTQPPKRSTSTYCRDVGLVRLEIESFAGEGAGRLETRLIHHGPRVNVHQSETLAPPVSEE